MTEALLLLHRVSGFVGNEEMRFRSLLKAMEIYNDLPAKAKASSGGEEHLREGEFTFFLLFFGGNKS
jgi:hypothetical protein